MGDLNARQKVTDRVKYQLQIFRQTAQSKVRSNYPNWAGRGSAAFRGWSIRQRAGVNADFPNEWRWSGALEVKSDEGVLVVATALTAWDIEVLGNYLGQLTIGYDVVLLTNVLPGGAAQRGTPTDSSETEELRARLGASALMVFEREDHGGEIAELAYLANAGVFDPYRVVLRAGPLAPLEADTRAPSVPILESLLPQGETGQRIVQAFASDPSLGIVAADGMVRGPEGWADSGALVEEILARIGTTLDYQDLHFADGQGYWIRGFLMQGLRALRLSRDDFADPFDVVSSPPVRALERVIGALAKESGTRIVELPDLVSEQTSPGSPTVVAVYSPEFFPAALEDRSWGRSFTQWNNYDLGVGREMPTYLPEQIGPYRLDIGAVLDQQWSWAEYAGVSAFLLRHYWFAGRQILGQVAEALVDEAPAESKFALMWCNEDWIQPLDGPRQEVEIAQDFGAVPASEFIEDALKYLGDLRYLRHAGRRVLVVSAPEQIPNFGDAAAHWRRRCKEEGLGDLLILGVADEVGGSFGRPPIDGLDGQVLLPPRGLPWIQSKRSVPELAPHGSSEGDPSGSTFSGPSLVQSFRGRVLSYRALAGSATSWIRAHALRKDEFPGVMSGFDSSPSGLSAADMWDGANPFAFREWLAKTQAELEREGRGDALVFVRAWNDWSTDSVIEPTERWGPTYLQAIRDVLGERDSL